MEHLQNESDESLDLIDIRQVSFGDLTDLLTQRFNGNNESELEATYSSLSNDQICAEIKRRVEGRYKIPNKDLIKALDLLSRMREVKPEGFHGVEEVKKAVLVRVGRAFFGVELET